MTERHHNQTPCPAACLLLLFLLCASSASATGPAPPGAGHKPAASSPAPAPVPVGARLKVVPVAEGGAGQNKHTIDGTAAAGTPPGTPERNPFSATGRMTGPSAGGGYSGRYGLDFTPAEQAGGMPKMRLRGQLHGADGKSVALLEIEGSGVHIVREKDTVGLQELGIDQAIRIKKITRLHVVVEAGSLGRLIIVH